MLKRCHSLLLFSFILFTNGALGQCPYDAAITGSETICQYETANLEIILSGGTPPFQVQLSTGSEVFSVNNYYPGQFIQVTPLVSTAYTLVEVRDAQDCLAGAISGIAPITVSPPPNAYSAEITACDSGNGQAVFDLTNLENIINGGNPSPVNWYHDPNASTIIPDPENFTSSTTTIYATVFNGDCESIPAAVTILIFPNPEPMISGNIDFCPGANTMLYLAGSYAAYNWSDGSIGLNLLVDSVGVYSVTVTSLDGCVGEASVEVNEINTSVLEIEGPSEICSDEDIILQASPGFSTYEWSTGSTDVSTIVNSPGYYFLTATDDYGCSQFNYISIGTILDLYCISSIPATDLFTADGQGSITVTEGTPPYQVFWSGAISGSASLLSEGELLVDSLVAGTYQVSVVDANGCTESRNLYILSNSLFSDCQAATFLPPLPQTFCNSYSGSAFLYDNLNQSTLLPSNLLANCISIPGNDSLLSDAWFHFTAVGEKTNIVFENTGLDQAYIAIFRSAQCYNPIPIQCGKGDSQTFELETIPGQSYYLMIAGSNDNDRGSFEFHINSTKFCDDCLIEDNLIANPPPLNEQYLPGDTVQFCYTLAAWQQVSGSWFHAIEVQFGGGWDLSSLEAESITTSCGVWSWYDQWESCTTGQTFGPGFAVENDLNGNCGPVIIGEDYDPGNNYGCPDFGFYNFTPVDFCWTIKVADCSSQVNQDLSIRVHALSDSQSGGWNATTGCSTTPSSYFEAYSTCDAPLSLEIQTEASNCLDANGTATATALGGTGQYSFQWSNGQHTNTINNLTPGAYSLTVSDGENEIVQNFSIQLDEIPIFNHARKYGGSGSEGKNIVTSTLDNGLIIGGVTSSSDGDIPNFYGYVDIWVGKLDSLDNLEWSASFGGSFSETLNDVIQLQDSSFLLVGSTNSNDGHFGSNLDSYNGWIIKLDTDGQIVWLQTFGTDGFDEVTAALELPNGNIVLAGSEGIGDNIPPNAYGVIDFWLAQITTNGQLIWEKRYGGSGVERASDLIQTSDGGFAIVGHTNSQDGLVEPFPNDYQDMWVIKTDASGNFVWGKRFGSPEYEEAYSIDEDEQSNLIVAGSAYPIYFSPLPNFNDKDAFVVKISPFGSTIWERTFGSDEGEELKKVIARNGYYLLGTTNATNTNTPTSLGEEDFWLVHLNSDGNMVWQQRYGGSDEDIGTDFTIRNNSEFVLVGQTLSDDNNLPAAIGNIDLLILNLWQGTLLDLDLGPDIFLCEGESYTLNGTIPDCFSCNYLWNTGATSPSITMNETGAYSLTVTEPGGCQAEDDIQITFEPTSQTQLFETICEGDTYFIAGQIFTQPGVYDFALQSSNGCDSIIYLELTVLPFLETNINSLICDGQTITIGNTTYDAPGQYTQTLTSSGGCDSIVYLTLITLPVYEVDVNASICSGEVYTIGNSTYDTSGQFTEILTSSNGCDSVVNLTLNVLPTYDIDINASICSGEVYTIGNTTYNVSGQFSETLTSSNGCDSVVNLTLNVLPAYDTDINASICSGEVYTIGNSTYDVSGQFTEILTSSNGCDSTVMLNLEVFSLPVPEITTSSTTLCTGESVTLNGSGGISYQWSTGANSQNINVTPLATTTFSLTVTDENGCIAATDITIEVDEQLAELTIDCSSLSPTEVIFTWQSIPGIESFQLVFAGQSQIISDTAFVVSGLVPEEMVSIEVTPIYDGVCPITSTTSSCSSSSCPDVMVTITDIPSLCTDDAPIQLEAFQMGGSGTGTYTWAGPGIHSANGLFDPAQVAPGTFTMTVTYTEDVCTYQASTNLSIFENPVAIFNLENKVCFDDFGTITFQGVAGPNAVYNWDFDGGTAVPGIGPGPHEVTWSIPGLKTLSLSIEENACLSEVYTRDVEVEPNLVAPSISCIGVNDQLAFGWPPVPGATGYDVNVLTGQTGILNNNILIVENLQSGEEVTVEVIALNGGGVCNESVDTLSCFAGDNPIFILAEPQFEIDEASETIQLTPETASGVGLKGPFPNPTQQQAWIEIYSEKEYQVCIDLLDINGRRQQIRSNSSLNKGRYKFEIETSHLPPGIYFVKVQIDDRLMSRKLIVIQ